MTRNTTTRSARRPRATSPRRHGLPRVVLILLVLPFAVLAAVAIACGPDPAPPDVLSNQVRAAIHADVRVAPYEVDVKVDDRGRVILHGEVDRPQVKEIAEKLAREVEGVHTLVNRIEVRPRDE